MRWTVMLVGEIEPGQKIERVRYDPGSFNRLPLREIEPGHFAAV